MPAFKCPKCGAVGGYDNKADGGFGFSDYNEVHSRCPEIAARLAVDGRIKDVSCLTLANEIARLRSRR